MEPSRGDSRYNLNYSMSNIGLTLTDPGDIYGNSSALNARPPSAGILQGLGGGSPGVGLLPRSAGNLISNTQCQSIGNNQQRGMKRAGSDCYEDAHHRIGSSGITTLQGLDNCGGSSNVQHSSQQQPQSSGVGVQDIVDESFNNMQSKKSPPANGKKTKGRVKIKMEYIDNKLRRYTTFSKRKTGIMKKAYELSTLTGTQVMLLVASETGHVYTFATRKLQPMITSEAGKQLIQTCLNSPDPPSLGSGDQRMSATGFEETELSYNIADEDTKDRSQCSSGNDTEESSDNEIGNVDVNNCSKAANFISENPTKSERSNKTSFNDKIEVNNYFKSGLPVKTQTEKKEKISKSSLIDTTHYISDLKSLPKNVLMQLIEGGHLEVHNEEDGSGHQYVAIPLPSSSTSGIQARLSNEKEVFNKHLPPHPHLILQKDVPPEFNIKEEP